MIDTSLLQLAAWKLNRELQKQAFVPGGGAPPMDPAMMGGGMPMDPAMMGGGMPMDPMAMGGAPPMDPMAMGGMPMDPMAMGGAPPMDPGMPPAPPAEEPMNGAGKKIKLDPAAIYVEQVRNRKLLIGLYQQLGLSLPEDILDDQDILAPGAVTGALAKSTKAPAKSENVSLPAIGDSPAVNPIEGVEGSRPSIRDIMGQAGAGASM